MERERTEVPHQIARYYLLLIALFPATFPNLLNIFRQEQLFNLIQHTFSRQLQVFFFFVLVGGCMSSPDCYLGSVDLLPVQSLQLLLGSNNWQPNRGWRRECRLR